MSVELAYSIANERGQGTPLVLVHGVGDSRHVWDAVLAGLPGDRPVIRYDLRGHCDSPKPDGPYKIDDLVTDHIALLDRLGYARADTVGFSLGGLVSQAIAIRHPERVRRLVLIGSVAGRTDVERERVLERLRMVRERGPLEVARESVTRWFTTDYLAAHPEAADETLARMGRLDPTAYANCYEVLATTDLADELHRIAAPTLAITGEHDVGSPPRMSRLIAARVPDARAVVIPNARHAVLRENTDRIAMEVARFVC
jgi:(E)-2-((N-methylformamido)methylene)succinate hydrolase